MRARAVRSGRRSILVDLPLAEADRVKLLGYLQKPVADGVELRVEALDGTGTSMPLTGNVQRSWTVREERTEPLTVSPRFAEAVAPAPAGGALLADAGGLPGVTTADPMVLQLHSALMVSYREREQLLYRVLESEADTRRSFVAITDTVVRGLAAQSSELRSVATSVATREAGLIGEVLEAGRRAADAETAAIVAAMENEQQTGADTSGTLEQLLGLVTAVKGGDPTTLLPSLVKRLAAGEGTAALRSAVAALGPAEQQQLAETVGAAMVPA
jgi:hypothetical protein